MPKRARISMGVWIEEALLGPLGPPPARDASASTGASGMFACCVVLCCVVLQSRSHARAGRRVAGQANRRRKELLRSAEKVRGIVAWKYMYCHLLSSCVCLVYLCVRVCFVRMINGTVWCI